MAEVAMAHFIATDFGYVPIAAEIARGMDEAVAKARLQKKSMEKARRRLEEPYIAQAKAEWMARKGR